MANGEITHVEFPADDIERARRFYKAVAGWDSQAMEGFPGYFMFRTGEGSGGAIGERGTSVGRTVRPYVTVTSLEDAIKAATENGGSPLSEPQEIPGMGRWASVVDSEGTELGLFEVPKG